MSGIPVLDIGGAGDVLSIGGDYVLAIGGNPPVLPSSPGGNARQNYADLGPADFEAAIAQRLLPRGLAWTRVAGSVLQSYWRVVADAIAAVHARAGVLTEVESFPPSSVELLSDWETVLGLPDSCLGVGPTTSARQALVAERLAATGGQSIGYFEALAAQLGATITIEEFAPFRAGIDVAAAGTVVATWFEASVSAAGAPLWVIARHAGAGIGALRGASWAYVWLVTIAGTQLQWFLAGISSAGEGLWTVPGGPVACEILRLAPAHTIVMFAAAENVNSTLGAVGPFLADYSLTDTEAYVT